MILFVKEQCAFSMRALKAAEALKAPLTIRWKHEEGVVDEVIAKGGKKQFPFLWDEENHTGMYESAEIVKKLCDEFGGEPDEHGTTEPHHCVVD
jgi:glutaredoxin